MQRVRRPCPHRSASPQGLSEAQGQISGSKRCWKTREQLIRQDSEGPAGRHDVLLRFDAEGQSRTQGRKDQRRRHNRGVLLGGL
jgi:hypothetical protein